MGPGLVQNTDGSSAAGESVCQEANKYVCVCAEKVRSKVKGRVPPNSCNLTITSAEETCINRILVKRKIPTVNNPIDFTLPFLFVNPFTPTFEDGWNDN